MIWEILKQWKKMFCIFKHSYILNYNNKVKGVNGEMVATKQHFYCKRCGYEMVRLIDAPQSNK